MSPVDIAASPILAPSVAPGLIGGAPWLSPASSRETAAQSVEPAPANASAEAQDVAARRIFLSTVAPSRQDWLLAASIALLSAIAFVVLAPFAKVQLAIAPAFVPTYESALLI